MFPERRYTTPEHGKQKNMGKHRPGEDLLLFHEMLSRKELNGIIQNKCSDVMKPVKVQLQIRRSELDGIKATRDSLKLGQ